MEIQFIDEEISSFGGVAILKKMMDKLSFEKVLSSLPCCLVQATNTRYDPPLYSPKNKQPKRQLLA